MTRNSLQGSLGRNSLILVACFGLSAGCATSSANSQPQNPDAGQVNYDIGQPNSGGSDGAAGNDGGNDGGNSGNTSTARGRDSLTTRSTGARPKAVKQIPTTKPPKADTPPTNTPQDPHGLLGEAYTIPASSEKLPEFGTLQPSGLFLVPSLDTGVRLPAAKKPPIAFRFLGSLNVINADEYMLCTTSRDGSQLVLEGMLVVDNNGLHAEPAQVCELVYLEAGEYNIEVHSFHVSGTIHLEVAWAVGKGGTPEPIPARNFFKPEDADARVKAGV